MQTATKLQFHSPLPETNHDHDHNCASCHHHDHQEKLTQTKSLIKKIHENNGHSCIDHNCDIAEPHGHIHHQHHHDHHHAPQGNTLEALIASSKLPQIFKEFLMNSSFMLPALFSSNFLEKLPLPKVVKTWLSITCMHLINRGNTKLGRLGLTYLISGAASFDKSLMHAHDSPYALNATRFLATSLIALIEKFGSEAQHKESKKQNSYEKTINEVKTIMANLIDSKKWAKFIPSLANIEAKVQILAPLTAYLISKIKISNSMLKTLLKGLAISASFVSSDSLLKYFAKSMGTDSSFATALSASCACCGSPVCTVAATDSAIANSM